LKRTFLSKSRAAPAPGRGLRSRLKENSDLMEGGPAALEVGKMVLTSGQALMRLQGVRGLFVALLYLYPHQQVRLGGRSFQVLTRFWEEPHGRLQVLPEGVKGLRKLRKPQKSLRIPSRLR